MSLYNRVYDLAKSIRHRLPNRSSEEGEGFKRSDTLISRLQG